MKKIDFYIIREMAGPFFFALGTVIFLFLFQFLIKSIDQLVGKGLSMWIIVQLIALNLAWMVTLAVPMAMLVASLMAFGSLSSNNEITILKASGISLPRLMLPVIILSLFMFFLMERFNNEVLPEANHQARVLLGNISRTKPTFILEPGKFSADIQGVQILVKKTYPNSNEIEDIYIYDYSKPNLKNLLTAKKGSIGYSSDFRNIIMDLEEGEIHQLNFTEYSKNYRKVKFDRHRLTLSAEGFGFQSSGDNSFIRGDREMPADEMKEVVDSLSAVNYKMDDNFIESIRSEVEKFSSIAYKDTVFKRPLAVNSEESIIAQRELQTMRDSAMFKANAFDTIQAMVSSLMRKSADVHNLDFMKKQVQAQIDSYRVEIYKKYSIPFACVVFVLVGATLGYRVRKGGFGIAAGLSLLFFLIYWACLIGGEKLADRDFLSPFFAMWLANIILGIFGLYLMFKSS